jgi:uncharacterized protein (TIGR04255 family)
MVQLPVALARDTILDCAFEMRFPGVHQGVSELLPGLVFGRFPQLFKNATPLPLAAMPQALREQNPQLRYAATQIIEGPTVRMLIGSHVATVSFARPYKGWASIQPQAIECMDAVLATKLTGRPERFSLKYVNLLQEGQNEFDLAQTLVTAKLGAFETLSKASLIVRAEIERSGCTVIVEVQTGTRVQASPGHPEAAGVMLNVDAVTTVPEGDVGAAMRQCLEKLHHVEKEIFFGLLTETTIKRLGPTYKSTH